ncbi:hypothetical protein E3N88_44804 [Mikania micrantha]|uniref:Uncharacterized protein n=1 Tax=Mikania micrantha TaxID=192012 RepID=A0A5N6LB03_9ASTR|nr:hypothetical protein E3N88_44804 [Mikania micrantha]
MTTRSTTVSLNTNVGRHHPYRRPLSCRHHHHQRLRHIHHRPPLPPSSLGFCRINSSIVHNTTDINLQAFRSTVLWRVAGLLSCYRRLQPVRHGGYAWVDSGGHGDGDGGKEDGNKWWW